MQRFAGTGNHPFFHQLNHAVGEQFGVYTQIAVVVQVGQHGVRNAANPHLQGGAIGNHFGNNFPNTFMYFGGFPLGGFRQWVIHFHNHVQIPDVDETVPVATGHLAVHFRNNQFGVFCCWFGGADFCTKGAKPVFIRRRQLHKCNINGENTQSE